MSLSVKASPSSVNGAVLLKPDASNKGGKGGKKFQIFEKNETENTPVVFGKLEKCFNEVCQLMDEAKNFAKENKGAEAALKYREVITLCNSLETANVRDGNLLTQLFCKKMSAYRHINEPQNAISASSQLLSQNKPVTDHGIKADLLMEYSQALSMVNRYDEADQNWESAIQLAKEPGIVANWRYYQLQLNVSIDRKIEICRRAIRAPIAEVDKGKFHVYLMRHLLAKKDISGLGSAFDAALKLKHRSEHLYAHAYLLYCRGAFPQTLEGLKLARSYIRDCLQRYIHLSGEEKRLLVDYGAQLCDQSISLTKKEAYILGPLYVEKLAFYEMIKDHEKIKAIYNNEIFQLKFFDSDMYQIYMIMMRSFASVHDFAFVQHYYDAIQQIEIVQYDPNLQAHALLTLKRLTNNKIDIKLVNIILFNPLLTLTWQDALRREKWEVQEIVFRR